MKVKFSFLRAKHLKLGKKGEDKVCEFLQKRACLIIKRNYRKFKDEIDIIALDGNVICFVEVKTRMAPLRTRPAWGLSQEQKKRIRHAAKHYLSEIGNPQLPYRFDLAELVFNRWDICEFRYWENNFNADFSL